MRGREATESILSQKSSYYQGIDNWQNCTIEKEELLVQFDHRPREVIENSQHIRSNYFTSYRTAKECLNSKKQVNGQKYGEMVQVFPREVNSPSSHRQYAGNVVVYRVEKPILASKSIVENNPLYGNGKAVQFHISLHKEDLISKGFLSRMEIIPTSDREHHLDWLSHLENQGLGRKEIEREIPQKHKELVNEWLKGTPEQRERAMNIIGMEREYERLLAEREKGMENAVSELQQEPAVPFTEMDKVQNAPEMEKGIEISPLDVFPESSEVGMDVSSGPTGLEIGGDGPAPAVDSGRDMEMGMK